MIIGLDFDNTVVCYNGIFHTLAVENGWIPKAVPVSKESVRNALREKGMEEQWIELQGRVYGPEMKRAEPFPGLMEFLELCRDRDAVVCIISHRTKYPFRGERYDLHAAAFDWLEEKKILSYGVVKRPLTFFELTKQEKIARICQIGCDWFVDDLVEFLSEPDFPAQTKKILFDPSEKAATKGGFNPARSWNEVGLLIWPSL